MQLYLLRHGEAEARASSDAERRLTSRGIEDLRSVARQCAAAGLVFDRCLVSPYLRARQSAAEFLPLAAAGLEAEVEPALKPESSVADLIRLLDGMAAARVLLIGHNPLLSELNAQLTQGELRGMAFLDTAELRETRLDIVAAGLGAAGLRLLPESRLAGSCRP